MAVTVDPSEQKAFEPWGERVDHTSAEFLEISGEIGMDQPFVQESVKKGPGQADGVAA